MYLDVCFADKESLQIHLYYAPRPFATIFLCKGIALYFILEFTILNLPILLVFKDY